MENWEPNFSRDVLERIAALLFALAGLADRAAVAPFLRRRHVLAILSHGEVEARAFVIGMVAGAPVSIDSLDTMGDAALLAIRLRTLAMALYAILAQAARWAPPVAARQRPGREKRAREAGHQLPPSAPDTS